MLAEDDVDAVADELEGTQPDEILRWAVRAIPRLTFATGFGAEGCVLIDVIARQALPIDLFTLDTGVLFPETYALWRQLETRYGLSIRAVVPEQSIADQALSHGAALWERDANRCCELRKINPLRRALAGFDGWITAIRRDQTPERANARIVERDRKFGLLKVNPLAGWSHDEVWAYIYAHDVPTNALHEQGYASIGCQPCTSPVALGENPRAGRWRGMAKKECGLHVVPSAEEKPDAA